MELLVLALVSSRGGVGGLRSPFHELFFGIGGLVHALHEAGAFGFCLGFDVFDFE